jgi:IclR family acetate operon transcriptional repressor
VIFVSQVETHETIRAFFRPGTRALFHASGIGKAILAHRAPDAVAASLKRTGLPRFTDRTLTRLPELLADLAEVRARGFAVDDEERNAGMRCVGAPIFNEFGEAVAGLSLSGPTVRVTPEAIARFGPHGARRGGAGDAVDRGRVPGRACLVAAGRRWGRRPPSPDLGRLWRPSRKGPEAL